MHHLWVFADFSLCKHLRVAHFKVFLYVQLCLNRVCWGLLPCEQRDFTGAREQIRSDALLVTTNDLSEF